MYFDAVLDRDMMPKFNGTSEETLVWLNDHPNYISHTDYAVCIGKTMQIVSTWEYVNMYNDSKKEQS